MSQNHVEGDKIPQSLALETAWERYAQLKTNASAAWRRYLNLQTGTIALLVLAVLLAIVTSSNRAQVLRACLIIAPIISLIVFVFARQWQQRQYWLVLNASAEALKQAIYLYRTLLRGQAKRDIWLHERVKSIQGQVSETVGANLLLQPYQEKIPPTDDPEAVSGDPGTKDLQPEDYYQYRLQPQLQWHTQEVALLSVTRTSLQIAILLLAGLSILLPAINSSLNIWVALTASMALALIFLLEAYRLDDRVNHYNQIIRELNIIGDRWQSLNLEQRTGEECWQLVLATEEALSLLQQQLRANQPTAPMQGETGELLTQIINSSSQEFTSLVKAKSGSQTLLLENPDAKTEITTDLEIVSEATTVNHQANKEPPAPPKPVKKGLPHAFVVMPFGRKKGRDGGWIDFDSIYQKLIKPALEQEGFEPFRADEETVSGDILTDMFQELLLADLVLADLSIDNANVFYELGIRHALRKRGVIHIQSGRDYMPYDIFSVRTLPYHCDDRGQPDEKYLEKDKQAIAKMVRETWSSDYNRIHSPIFNLLNGLPEPERKSLRTPLATGYWEEYHKWQEWVTIAQRQKNVGDVLLLTEEVSNPLIKSQVLDEAGKALKKLGNHALALQQYQQGLKLEPKNSEFRREEAFHLSRLQRSDEAIVKLEGLLQDEPTNIEAISYLARIYKEIWREQWWNSSDESRQPIKEAYESAQLLAKAIETYLRAYRLDQNHYYSGINALTLSAILDYLAQQFSTDTDYNPEEQALKHQLPCLIGAIQFCLESAAQQEPNNFWVFISLGDLAVCTASSPLQVTRAYKKALTLLWNNKFALESTLEQLHLLEKLNFRPEYVQAGIAVLQEEMDRLKKQQKEFAAEQDNQPMQVFLFSGHMIDRHDRPQPRFPAAMESEAQEKIEKILDKLQASAQDLAIAPGIACGGDILFLEACLRRNMKVEVFLPFEAAKFIQESVSFADNDWVERFYKIKDHPKVKISLMPDRLGKVPSGENPFERNNRWTLYSTLMYGIERVRLIVLWNGEGGDGPGGTGHMVQLVHQLGGIVEHLDTTKFDYWDTQAQRSNE